jgi:hypothetical protein
MFALALFDSERGTAIIKLYSQLCSISVSVSIASLEADEKPCSLHIALTDILRILLCTEPLSAAILNRVHHVVQSNSTQSLTQCWLWMKSFRDTNIIDARNKKSNQSLDSYLKNWCTGKFLKYWNFYRECMVNFTWRADLALHLL